MHHVFVSYSRTDSEWVTQLVKRLERHGLATWLDQRDIPLTLPWFEEISAAIVAADLFLICDSPASRESASCGAETRLALDAAKRAVEVEVGADVGRAAGLVAQATEDLPGDYKIRTELSVLAQNWDRGGRKRGSLVSGRSRRRLQHGAGAQPPLRPHERSFLRDSRSRSRRRIGVSVAVGLTIGLSVLTATVLNEVENRLSKQLDEQAVGYMRTHATLDRSRDDPYTALGEAAGAGGDESATGALVAEAGFAATVPDEAFAVPASARRFATPEVDGDVIVTDDRGGFWGRPSAAADTTVAAAVEPPSKGEGADGPVEAQLLDGGVVEVTRAGRLWRLIAFSQRPAALRLSPNGRELAAGARGYAEIADLQLGAVRTTVSGAVGSIRDLAWSTDGRRLWALGGKRVVSWPVREGRVLLDAPNKSFEALLPAAEDSQAWAVAGDGGLLRFSIDDGRVLERLRVPDEVMSGAGSPDGSVAALSGRRGIWIAPLDGDLRPRLVKPADCAPGRATFPDSRTFYLPCLSGPILRLSVASGKVLRRIELGPAGVFAVKAMPRRDVLLAGDQFAHLYAIPEGGQPREIFYAPCGGTISRIAVSADERVAVPTGSGAGITGCVRRGVLTGNDPVSASSWSFTATNDAVGSALAGAAAASDDGRLFAFGYSDGTVVLHPTINISPQRKITNVAGEIRDMRVAAGNRLLVATRAGIVQRIQLCPRCLSNAAFADSARHLVERGIEIGTARSVNRERAR